jgi:hypothetical protein
VSALWVESRVGKIATKENEKSRSTKARVVHGLENVCLVSFSRSGNLCIGVGERKRRKRKD